MEYAAFLDEVKHCAERRMKENGQVKISHVMKNNGYELDGLVMLEHGKTVAPTIYLNEFYQQYVSGRQLGDIVDEIFSIYNGNKDKLKMNIGHFEDFTQMRKKIVYKVINYERNRKLLALIPHKKYMDLAVVYYCILAEDEQVGTRATALVHNSHMDLWNVTAEEIYEAALENTPKTLPMYLRPITELVQSMITGESDMDEDLVENTSEMYVLTNRSRLFGAACMLYENVLEEIATQWQSDLYILPSSVHEVLLLPKNSYYEKAELEKMVQAVNAEGVSADEILSNHVYVYCREKGIVRY